MQSEPYSRPNLGCHTCLSYCGASTAAPLQGSTSDETAANQRAKWTRSLNAKEPTCERSKRSIRRQRAKWMHGSTLWYVANVQRLQVQLSLFEYLLPNRPRNDTRWPTTSRHGSHLPSAMLNTTFLRAPEAHPQGGERKEPQLGQYLQH
jgi:hypothetical protein